MGSCESVRVFVSVRNVRMKRGKCLGLLCTGVGMGTDKGFMCWKCSDEATKVRGALMHCDRNGCW